MKSIFIGLVQPASFMLQPREECPAEGHRDNLSLSIFVVVVAVFVSI